MIEWLTDTDKAVLKEVADEIKIEFGPPETIIKVAVNCSNMNDVKFISQAIEDKLKGLK